MKNLEKPFGYTANFSFASGSSQTVQVNIDSTYSLAVTTVDVALFALSGGTPRRITSNLNTSDSFTISVTDEGGQQLTNVATDIFSWVSQFRDTNNDELWFLPKKRLLNITISHVSVTGTFNFPSGQITSRLYIGGYQTTADSYEGYLTEKSLNYNKVRNAVR